MSARKYIWTPEKYRQILLGNRGEGIEGLRNLASGFDSKDGYNINRVDKWTKYQKQKVRDYFHRLEQLQAQPKRVIRPKDQKKLRKLQDAFHGGIPSENFKVAFIPDTDPQTTLPGAKKHPPKVRILKEGVSILRTQYERIFIPFDQKRLASNPRQEIARAAKHMPRAKMFFVQVGQYENLVGRSITLVTEQILQWMEQYDGKKPLPRTSGNVGDDPKWHHWKYWLNGIYGYIMPRHVDIRKLGRIIHKGRQDAKEQARIRQNYMKRRGTKRKGTKK